MKLANFCFVLAFMPFLVVAAPKAATSPSTKFPALNNTIGLAHRWSFQEDMEDSVGTVDAVLRGTAQLNEGSVRTFGGKHETSWIDIPGDVLPADRSAFTLELWATPLSVQEWSRVFQLHFEPGQHCNKKDGYKDICWTWSKHRDSSSSRACHLRTEVDVTPGFELGKQAHIFWMGSSNPKTATYEFRGFVWYKGERIPHATFVISVEKCKKDYDVMRYLVLGKSRFNPTFHVRVKNPSVCWGSGRRSSLHFRFCRLGEVA